MKIKPLGTSELNVSDLCMGTMMMGSQNTTQESKIILSEAKEQGINFYDTAELYSVPPCAETHGNSERIIGEWLSEVGQRDQLVIATKVAGRSDMKWLRGSENKNTVILDEANINYAIEHSLTRLKTDYIDLYQIHWPDRPISNFGFDLDDASIDNPDYIPVSETLEILAGLVKQGKIRYVGVSNENLEGVKEFTRLAKEKGLPMIASIQNAYSLVNRGFEKELADYCLTENIGLLPYSILAMGFLSGKYMNGQLPEGSRKALFKNTHRYRALEENEKILEDYEHIAKKEGLTMSQMAHAFVYRQAFIGSTIIGGTSIDQLHDNIAAQTIELSDDCLSSINEVHERYPNPCV